jgi:hypothetical protein
MLNIGGKVTKVPKLNEAKAIEQGSEILSEVIILSIAAAILIYEYNRSKEKEDAKELAKTQEAERIKNKIFEMEFKQDKQTTQIRELSKLVIELKEHEHKRSIKRIFTAHPEVSPEIISSAQEEDKPKDEPQPPPPLTPTGDEENQGEDVPPPIQSHLDSGLPTQQSSSPLVIFKSPNTYIGVTLMACAILADFVYYL